jgi:hypothetical protein
VPAQRLSSGFDPAGSTKMASFGAPAPRQDTNRLRSLNFCSSLQFSFFPLSFHISHAALNNSNSQPAGPQKHTGITTSYTETHTQKPIPYTPYTMTSRETIPIGTRKSALAIAQTVQVQSALERLNPTKSFPLLRMSTTGDNIQGQPLSSIGTTALFTRELETSLEKKECDMLVHSLKDVPTQVKPGFVIGAMMKREEPSDVMVMRPGEFKALKDFGEGDVVGTSSVRRASQIRRLCPGVQVKDVVSLLWVFLC